jgi:hypothetical protein
MAISCLFPVIFQNWKNTSQPSEDLQSFLNGGTGKVTMDLKQKQRAVIEFLLLEGCEGDDIVFRLQNAYGRDAYCWASVFRWMNEICRGSEEIRNEGRLGRPYRYETDAALRSILRNDLNASLLTMADTLSISPETVRTHIEAQSVVATDCSRSQRISAGTPFDTVVSIYFISEMIKSLFIPVPLLSFVYQWSLRTFWSFTVSISCRHLIINHFLDRKKAIRNQIHMQYSAISADAMHHLERLRWWRWSRKQRRDDLSNEFGSKMSLWSLWT